MSILLDNTGEQFRSHDAATLENSKPDGCLIEFLENDPLLVNKTRMAFGASFFTIIWRW